MSKVTQQTRHGAWTFEKPYESDILNGFQSKLACKLIELGVLPPSVRDFTINNPLEGDVTITCTFNADERLEQAIKDLSDDRTNTKTDEPEDTRG